MRSPLAEMRSPLEEMRSPLAERRSRSLSGGSAFSEDDSSPMRVGEPSGGRSRKGSIEGRAIAFAAVAGMAAALEVHELEFMNYTAK